LRPDHFYRDRGGYRVKKTFDSRLLTLDSLLSRLSATHTPLSAVTPVSATHTEKGDGERVAVNNNHSELERRVPGLRRPRAVILRRNRSGSDEESRVSLEVDWL
jgi:hypothetical protein